MIYYFDGTRRFGELHSSLAGISPKTLPEKLRELEQAGIIKRKIYAEVPPRVEYSLTRRGQKLDKVFNEMKTWGSQLPEALTPVFDESY